MQASYTFEVGRLSFLEVLVLVLLEVTEGSLRLVAGMGDPLWQDLVDVFDG